MQEKNRTSAQKPYPGRCRRGAGERTGGRTYRLVMRKSGAFVGDKLRCSQELERGWAGERGELSTKGKKNRSLP